MLNHYFSEIFSVKRYARVCVCACACTFAHVHAVDIYQRQDLEQEHDEGGYLRDGGGGATAVLPRGRRSVALLTADRRHQIWAPARRWDANPVAFIWDPAVPLGYGGTSLAETAQSLGRKAATVSLCRYSIRMKTICEWTDFTKGCYYGYFWSGFQTANVFFFYFVYSQLYAYRSPPSASGLD